VQLTPLEFRLLSTFVRHPRQVLSREQISLQVWGADADVTSNVVETYIHYLREKIDRGFARLLDFYERTVRRADCELDSVRSIWIIHTAIERNSSVNK